jgi:hypothetical protein
LLIIIGLNIPPCYSQFYGFYETDNPHDGSKFVNYENLTEAQQDSVKRAIEEEQRGPVDQNIREVSNGSGVIIEYNDKNYALYSGEAVCFVDPNVYLRYGLIVLGTVMIYWRIHKRVLAPLIYRRLISIFFQT